MTIRDLDEALRHYLGAALWSSVDEDNTPLDARFRVSDITGQSKDQARIHLADFINANAADLSGISPPQAGHDFWLTRNGHGAGFWDRGLGDIGDRLTKACESYGKVDPYVGDDGLIYIDD